ncbi:cytochrome b [Acidovorax radicis]|uniref:cytochrome b n=1 Tax=Acidovorax radicis TaxID=758826 RepID=UPI001CF7F549|nr:cytochrome b [Acidovorax radicis]UCU97757.1 cytochrome b [Acidovorax radicis]
MQHDKQHYTNASIALHWLMAALLVATAATMELKGIYPKGSAARDTLKAVHYMLGASIFILVWLRLLARSVGSTPPIQPALPAWQARFGVFVHIALYVLMIGLPVLGLLTLSADGKPVALLWGWQLPLLPLEASRDNAYWLKELHETGATVGYVLVGLHAAAALFHHYFQRDNTLLRMLPGRR